MGTCDYPTPRTTNRMQQYSSGSGVSSISMIPQTLLGQITSLKSGTGKNLDKNTIFDGSRCSPLTNYRSNYSEITI